MTAPLRRNGMLVATIKRGCEDKRRYSDEVGARASGMYLSDQKGVTLYLYPCGVCQGWHLTSKKQKRRDRAVNFQYSRTPR